jgi:hypothetical protein
VTLHLGLTLEALDLLFEHDDDIIALRIGNVVAAPALRGSNPRSIQSMVNCCSLIAS